MTKINDESKLRIAAKFAALPHGVNYNAAKDYRVNGTEAATVKFTTAHMLRYPVITRTIHNNFGTLPTMLYAEESYGQAYVCDFDFEKVVLMGEKRVVLGGHLRVGKRSSGYGYIEHNFSNGKCYRVDVQKTGRIVRRNEVTPDKCNRAGYDACLQLIDFISMILEEEKNYENYVDTHGPTISKPR